MTARKPRQTADKPLSGENTDTGIEPTEPTEPTEPDTDGTEPDTDGTEDDTDDFPDEYFSEGIAGEWLSQLTSPQLHTLKALIAVELSGRNSDTGVY